MAPEATFVGSPNPAPPEAKSQFPSKQWKAKLETEIPERVFHVGKAGGHYWDGLAARVFQLRENRLWG